MNKCKVNRPKGNDGAEGIMKRIGVVALTLLLSPGCVVVGGYSSEGGWWLWPGTIVIFLIVAVLFLIFRRRR